MRRLVSILVLGTFVNIGPLLDCRAGEESSHTPLSVSPSQVMLGSLTFGRSRDNSIPIQFVVSGLPRGTRVTNIDYSHAGGIVPVSQRCEGQNVIVDVTIDVQKLCAGEPYGAFIRREIRLETDWPDQPQFVVPITGWLDINNTPRDFNQYVFEGASRWQGIWATPNIAGAELTAFVLILIGIVGWLQRLIQERRVTAGMAGIVAAISLICPALIWLGQTYSREAWIALFIAAGITAVVCPPLRRAAWGVLFSFSLILLFLPHGLQRVESYANVTGDLSIANRLKLWEGALQIMAEHPFAGIGSGQFETIFEQDYQEFDHTAKTATAVNDFLTFGAEHGLFSLSLMTGLILLVVTSALRLVSRSQCILLMTLTSVLLETLIASSFSTLWVVPDFQLLVGIALLGLSGYGATMAILSDECSRVGKVLLLRLSKCTVLTLVIWFILAVASLSLLPTRIISYHVFEHDADSASFQVVAPRWQPSPRNNHLSDVGH